jgi:hypothetical protein
MLVGLERDWSQKDLGTRTFTIAAIAGTLSILTAAPVAYITFAGVLLIILLTGLRNIHDGKPVETTTSAALTHFAGGLKVNEVRSAVLLGLLCLCDLPGADFRTAIGVAAPLYSWRSALIGSTCEARYAGR